MYLKCNGKSSHYKNCVDGPPRGCVMADQQVRVSPI